MHPESSVDDSFRARVARAKKMTGAERIQAGSKLSEMAMQIMESGIRDQHPDTDEATIDALMKERLRLKRRLENREVQ